MGEHKINVLVVDDNLEFRGILCDFLSTYENINIVGVGNDGIEALKLIKGKKPDLVILDIIMPRLDGLAVLSELSKMNLDSIPKIMMLSTVEQNEITQKAISLGADYYIIKPFDMFVLYKRILKMFI